MDYFFLTQDFYDRYDETNYPELERKSTRPYTMVKVTINNLDFGIPFRSGIAHPYALWTDKKNNCGLDYSKAVLIPDNTYISDETVFIRDEEHKSLKGREYLLQIGFEKYIEKYQKALSRPDIERNRTMCKFSTLQYFHKELGIE